LVDAAFGAVLVEVEALPVVELVDVVVVVVVVVLEVGLDGAVGLAGNGIGVARATAASVGRGLAAVDVGAAAAGFAEPT
jgi:hypothetical protein